jgi:folate-binding protein YgfZ
MSSQEQLFVRLDNLGCIELSGLQAQEYLQGQVTINTSKMSPNAARIGAHCDFKGKTWAVFIAALLDGNYKLIMHSSVIDKSLSVLKKYGVFSKVDISPIDAEMAFFGIRGSTASALIKKSFPGLKQDHLSVVENEFGFAICINITSPRYILALNAEGQRSFEQQAISDEDAARSKWEALDILDALPTVTAQTTNEFVPQMMNLQAIAGIDFDKGCYMGQETIARTKFLGRNKRATFILIGEPVSSSIALEPSMSLEKQAGENWRSGGTVLRSVTVDNCSMLLAVLANDTQIGDVLRLKAFPEQKFEVQALPYTLDEK